jgi:peptide/nickel transport system ATP-binding protein
MLDAVVDVDLDLERGRSLGIVGESGSGKSTLARVIAGLQAPTSGTVALSVGAPQHGRMRPRVQMVFQDPTSSLDPRQRAGDAIAEVLRVHHIVLRDQVARRVHDLLARVGLPGTVAESLPRHLSGGQRQRVAIARALASEPELLVADEAVASLDVSVKAGILNLLRDLQHELGLTLILITHDLATVGHACDQIAVMHQGRIVEWGNAEHVLGAPRHEYTAALLAAVPRLPAARSGRRVGAG